MVSKEFLFKECNTIRESDDEDWDYERENWYAMTDGMYGDMPEDFDGDYSFLGY